MSGVRAIIADATSAREPRITEAGQGSRAWMITLVDLVSLIMVFFVLLIAMSSIERKTWMELAGKLASSGIVAPPSPDSAEPRSANLARSAALDHSRLAYYRKIVLERFPRVSTPRLPLSLSPALRFTEAEQAGAVEVDVGEEQRHRAASGDLPGFVQIGYCAIWAGAATGQTPLPCTGEESAGKMMRRASAAEAGHGGVEG